MLLAGLTFANTSAAQDSMLLSDEETTVRSVRFRFVGDHHYHGERLAEEMVTRGPGFADRMRILFDFLPFVEAPIHLLYPIELQRDMVRLRRFYLRNGFLNASVDYPASQYRLGKNSMAVIVTIDEGKPLTVSTRRIRSQTPVPERLLKGWDRIVARAGLKPGDRFTDFDRFRVESELSTWLQDRGFAFAEVTTDLQIDSLRSLVALDLLAHLGPAVVIDSIAVEGNVSVSRGTVLRELPFEIDDRFNGSKLADGQRALSGLNLFRVALVDLPEQEADSLVMVRIRLREAKHQKVSLQTGYSREVGATVGASWRHHNFLGDARQLTLATSAQNGLLANPPVGRAAIKRYSGSIGIHQPYFFRHNLAGSLSLTGLSLDDPNLRTHYREVGVSPALILSVLPFRPVSLQYSLSRAEPLSQSTSLVDLGLFSQDVISASFTAGKLDNYLNPRKGWIIRPSAELAGTALSADVAYVKGALNAVAYIPITRRSSVAISLDLGRLSPRGPSRDQFDPNTEFRFDPIRFYSGGANDVRGWGLNALGPQIARADSIVANPDGSFSATGARYEAVGGLGKVAGSVGIRVPAPFLGPAWRTEAFLDFGGLSSRLVRDADGRAQFDGNEQPLVSDSGFPSLGELRWAAGLGLNLLTPAGAIRFDLAYKLNPSADDLHDPRDVVLFDQGLAGPPPSPVRRRFSFHLSIRRAF